MNKNIMYHFSDNLRGKKETEDFKEKLNELSETAKLLSPDGEVYVFMIDKKELYSPQTKVIRAMRDLKRLYSIQSFQRNPEIAVEFQKIAESMKKINDTVAKRRQKNRKSQNAKRKDSSEKGE